MLATRLRGCKFNPILQHHLGEGGSTVLYPGNLSCLGLGDLLITLDVLEYYLGTLDSIQSLSVLGTVSCNYLFVKWGVILVRK